MQQSVILPAARSQSRQDRSRRSHGEGYDGGPQGLLSLMVIGGRRGGGGGVHLMLCQQREASASKQLKDGDFEGKAPGLTTPPTCPRSLCTQVYAMCAHTHNGWVIPMNSNKK